MSTRKTDSNVFDKESTDIQRDMGAKGGPTTSLGNADGRHVVSSPYSEDIQTQLAANSHKKKSDTNDAKKSN